MKTPVLNETQIADNMIRDNFEENNFVALCVPGKDYATEKKLIQKLVARKEVDNIVGLSSQEAMGGYVLTDSLTPRQFSELLDMDVELCELLYSAYAADQKEYGRIVGGISHFQIPLIDTIMYVYDKVEEGYITLEPETMDTLTDIYRQIENARKQLQGENYDRMLVYLNLPQESDETFAFLDEIHRIC